jgi:nitroreductase
MPNHNKTLTMIKDLILKNRSYRRFFQEERISLQQLEGWVDLARLSPSAKNMQSMRYILSADIAANNLIFPALMWAGYLKEWSGPEEGERPSAYIVMLNDESLSQNYFCDDGIAAQSIMLGAVEMGYGGCMIATVNREMLRKSLNIPDKFKIIQVLALGKPKEIVQLETIKPDGDVKYWRDENHVHHVPKRELKDLIIKL